MKGKKPAKKNYFVDLPPSMPPVRIYIGAPTQSEAQKNVSGDDLIPHPKKKKGKKSKAKAKSKSKNKAAVALPGDEEIEPVAKSASNGSPIVYPKPEPKAPAVQVVAPAAAPKPEPQKPAMSAAERAVMSEGLPLPRNRKPKVLDADAAHPTAVSDKAQ